MMTYHISLMFNNPYTCLLEGQGYQYAKRTNNNCIISVTSISITYSAQGVFCIFMQPSQQPYEMGRVSIPYMRTAKYRKLT